jgi:UDPglucose 6-dehydrogenase
MPSGQPDLRFVARAAQTIAQNLNGKLQVVVNKSTVPVGTGDWVARIIEEHAVDSHANRYVVVSNPEFLREGTALYDSLYPDRIVLGSEDGRGIARMRDLYAPLLDQTFDPPAYVPRPVDYDRPELVTTGLSSAEMIKYAANAFLALKISFANEIAGLCERVDADIQEVTRGIGHDSRIGPRFLSAGAGWGGSCFGKDTSALISTGEEYGYTMPILKAAIEVNRRQRHLVIAKLQQHLHRLKGKRIAVLGMAFKPNTDDLRDAPAHDCIVRLTDLGATVVAHDPIAMDRARHEWSHLNYVEADSVETALRGADAVIVMTEWAEYCDLDWNQVLRGMRRPLVIDARGVIKDIPAFGEVEQIGRKSKGERPVRGDGVRIAVTGSAGFVGSHLVERFLADGHEVVGIDNYLSGQQRNTDLFMDHDRFEFIQADVSHEIPYTGGRLDWVLHFASPASPPHYQQFPIETLMVGAQGTQNALELARAHDAKFMLASTSEVYGDPHIHPQPETYWGHVNPNGLRSCYDEAKRYAEAITMAYHRHHGVDTRIIRIFNTYGPRMRHDDGRVVTNFIHQALRGEHLTVYGDGSQTRSFQFVTDLVEGIVRLMGVTHPSP